MPWWSGRRSVGYRRVWLSDRVVELEPDPARIATAEVRCPTCRTRWEDSSPEFWLTVHESRNFPHWCPLCGHEMPEWKLQEPERPRRHGGPAPARLQARVRSGRVRKGCREATYTVMSTSTDSQPAPIAALLSEPLRVGDPDVVGPLAVFPVFGAEAELSFESFAQGRERGVRIGELESGASVNDLVVENPGDTAVLLFEGEEVLGAQQNRTFDVSVLVGAGAKLRVPVSCVEAGRWQGSRHSESFAPAPQAAYPRMRRLKADVASAATSR